VNRNWLSRMRTGVLAVLLLLVTGYAALRWCEPEFHATFVILSEVEIVGPQISAGTIPVIHRLGAGPRDRFFAWEAVLPPAARHTPIVEVGWHGPDGQAHRIRERVPHNEYQQRCVHFLRLDATAAPIQVGRRYDGTPYHFDSSCRQVS
jgi:hypothetical protein